MSDHPPAETRPGYETRDANIRTIVLVGCALVAAAVVIHIGVWGLFDYLKRRADRANQARMARLPVVRAEMAQREAGLARRPPQPRLEAFEPTHARIILETADGQEHVFYVDTPVTVVRRAEGGEEKVEPNLYDVLPGTEVSLTYLDPQGLYGRPRVIRIEVGGEAPGDADRPREGGVRTVAGKIKRIDPESGPDIRQAGEADLGRYGWVDRKKDVAHIPIDQAMRLLVERHMLKSKPAKEEGERQ
jgi:hypothetical protein